MIGFLMVTRQPGVGAIQAEGLLPLLYVATPSLCAPLCHCSPGTALQGPPRAILIHG